MHRSGLLVLASSWLLRAAASPPRGVSKEDAKLYMPSSEGKFACISRPSIVVDFSRVNDDYCDCPDGSDEPGTSACASLPPSSLVIRGFYCRNHDHTPAYLPLSRVNDGSCDYDICCDGSDEYAGIGGIRCPSKCKEIGAKARKLAANRHKRRSEGARVKAELLKRATILRKDVEDKIRTTKAKIESTEVKVKQLADALKETERRERAKIVKNPSPGSKVPVVVQVAKDKVAEYKTLLEKVRNERDEAERKLGIAETILRTFKEEYNPNFNDEGVKRAVRAWEEYLASGNQPREKNRAEESDLNELINNEGVDWDELAGDVGRHDEVAALYRFEEYLPAGVRDWLHNKLDELRNFLVDNGVLAPRKDSGTESQAVVRAREALQSAERDNEGSKTELSQHESDLGQVYGPSDVFRALKGECISRESGEYRYEYCFLDSAHQISLKDSSRVSLGGFSSIVTGHSSSNDEAAGMFESGWEEAHDEPLSDTVIKHDKGLQCWNGPQRSVDIKLYCNAVNEIRNVVELEKCVYMFEVGTAAVCEDINSSTGQNIKDEL